MSEERLVFFAHLPPIKSAILIDGMGDGGQIKLEVPRTSRDALLLLGEWAGRLLRVEITTAQEDDRPEARKSRKLHI